MAGGTAHDGVPSRVDQEASVVGAGMVVQAGRDATVIHQLPARKVAWPVRVGVPPLLAEHYQERDAHARLAEVLAAEHHGPEVAVHRGVVVSGLGGVGKSQLAARHAWSVWRETTVDVAVWVSALSRDAIVAAYAEAATRVLVEHDPHIAARAPERAAGLFREWLAATSRRWLIVLDDVQDVADLRGLAPPSGPLGRVVLTSRLRDTALTRGGHLLIDLTVFTEAEAVAYLTGALRDRDGNAERDQLWRLAQDLGSLPLALGQAAAFIADQPLLTVAEYRELLADRRRTLAELTPAEDALPEHQATVAVTWSLSIDRADRPGGSGRDGGAGLALLVLEVASLLDPNGTPLRVFTSSAVRGHLAVQADRDIDDHDILDALTRLHRFSLITLNPAGTIRTVAVHALVQRAVRDTLTPERLHALARTTADALHITWPDIDASDADLTQALRSATTTLHARTAPALWTPRLHPVLFRVGQSLRDTGQVDAAVSYWQVLHGEALTELGPDHPNTLAARGNLALSRGSAGDPAAAVAELEALIADQLRVLGADHRSTLRTRNNLAHWRTETGDSAGAAIELEALLADRLRLLGPDDLDTLLTRSNLARSRGQAGDVAGAVTELEALLSDQLRVLGPDHLDTLAARGNLSSLWAQAGDPARAVAALADLIRDQARVSGPDHPHTLALRHNLGFLTGAAGDPVRAVTELEGVLADRLRVLGPHHPHTILTRSALTHWRKQVDESGHT